ncbi:lipocalin family protein [Faucicola boevrei]|uniref:lipocalin family protein n=1 Tax=Faucicola boevrei TaxID=346665 RepID=UPI00039A7E7E|nr:lipocalin family protein [Moraxella boevrei]
MKLSKTLMITGLIGSTILLNSQTFAKTSQSIEQTAKPQAVESLNVQRYVGQWYEIARLPMFFQNKCASDVKANYQLQDDGSIQVVNQCKTKTGETMQAVGKAVSDNGSSSQLLVTFMPKWLRWLPFGKAGYWVLALDNEYRYALVGTPNQKYLWLLSRTPTMPNDVYQNYVNIAKTQGYDVSKLQKTVQN